MFSYANDTILENETETQFNELGIVDMKRLNGAIPFYQINDNDKDYNYNVTEDERCGGSCLDYLQSFMNITFTSNNNSWSDYNSTYVSPRVCEEEDIGKKLIDTGNLFICPPKEGLYM
jgi:hypothetical protein